MPHSTRRPQLTSLFISLALIVFFASAVQAQSALDGFDPNANGSVWIVVVQSDGKILIGGDFTVVQGISRNRIARLNSDGTLDNAFDPNANGTVYTLALQANGKILAGGLFNGAGGIGGQTRNYIARLDATTGMADSSFDPNANNIVLSIAVQPDGGVLVGGAFTSIGGQARNCIARLNATTGLADSFNPNANSTVLAIAVAGGKILVGGAFSGANSIGGQTRNYIARFDVATGGVEAWDPNANFSVRSFSVQADGKILVGGDFSGANSIGGQTRNRIARLDATTGLADTFNPNASAQVAAIAVQPDGKILAGGPFNSIGGQSRAGIARLNPDGALDNAFNPTANGGVAAIVLQTDGKILAGGNFTTLAPNGGAPVTRNRIARLESDGRLDQTLDLNILPANGLVSSTAVQPDGKILIGGDFDTVLGVTRNSIARLNVDGTLDTAFNPNANNDVFSFVVQSDGKILVGGLFTSIGGETRNYIARLNPDGTLDSFNPDANSVVYSIAVQVDGRILVGGNFTTIGGQARNRIARFDPTSGAVESFNPNAISNVLSIALQADGKILVGGTFNSIGGQPRNNIARLDPATGMADSFNPNAEAEVYSIAVQPDGKILLGGLFTSIGGQPRNRLARLNPDGLADSFDPNANSNVFSITVQADGMILVGGGFQGANSIGGQSRNRIARLDPVTGMADSFNPNANGIVYSIAVQSDGKVLAGGNFNGANSVGGQTRNYFARLSNDTPAVQNLSATQTTVMWTRGGSSPQLSRVTFESSTDNVNYTSLGNGTAAGSNWTLTGLSLPTAQNIYIRARGYRRSGYLNGSESITESVRNAFLTAAPTITGVVTYGNAIGNPVPPRFVKNVSLSSTAGSPAVGPVITGTPGTYMLTGFGAGSYTIKPTKPGGSNGAVTSNDAARIAQGVSGSLPFVSNNQRFAADTTGNGGISSQDAAKLAQFVAGLPFSPPNFTGEWRFFTSNLPAFPAGAHPQERTYASVTSSLTGEDYVGILIGETSGNWNPATHSRPAGIVESGKWKVESENGGPERGIEVKLPQMTASTENEIVVPVNVRGVADKGIISYEFDLRYDPMVIQPLENPVDLTGTVSRGLFVVTNAKEPGFLRVVMYGALPIDENGVLLNFRFIAVGVTGSVSPLMFDRIMFNEGEPLVIATEGLITLF